jgi:hypothetical protein
MASVVAAQGERPRTAEEDRRSEQSGRARPDRVADLIHQLVPVMKRALEHSEDARQTVSSLMDDIGAAAGEFLASRAEIHGRPPDYPPPQRRAPKVFVSHAGAAGARGAALDYVLNLIYFFCPDERADVLIDSGGRKDVFPAEKIIHGALTCRVALAVVTPEYVTSERSLLEYALLGARCRRAAKQETPDFALVNDFFDPVNKEKWPAALRALGVKEFPLPSAVNIVCTESFAHGHSWVAVAAIRRLLPRPPVVYRPEMLERYLAKFVSLPDTVERWVVWLPKEADPAEVKRKLCALSVDVPDEPNLDNLFTCVIAAPALAKNPRSFIESVLRTFGDDNVHVEPHSEPYAS